MLITEAVLAHAAEKPEKTALVVDHRRLTYQELDKAINEAACELMAFENSFNQAGHTLIGFLLHNSVEFVQYFLAAAKLGLCSALFDPKWADANIDAILGSAGRLFWLLASICCLAWPVFLIRRS